MPKESNLITEDQETKPKRTRHPRKSRGWFALRKRWQKWLSLTGMLVVDTVRFFRPQLQLSTIMLVLGFVFMSSWVLYWWKQNALLKLERDMLLTYQLSYSPVEDKPHPTHIFIEWFVNSPVTDGLVANETWTVSDNSATYLTQSARPGTDGNIIIYGHNTRAILGNIRALKGYEKIRLTLSDGSTRWYQVKKLAQVKPQEMHYLDQTDSEMLTLYTCAGFADAERFIVQAEPIEINLQVN